jgi:hypothetical protein
MSNFYVDWVVSVVPIEELIAADTTTKPRIVHSTIDKIPTSKYEEDCADSATNINYGTYTTTTSGVALSTITSGYGGAGCQSLYIKIISAASSATPNVMVSIDAGSNYDIFIEGVGNWLKIGFAAITIGAIYIKSLSATTIANIEAMDTI